MIVVHKPSPDLELRKSRSIADFIVSKKKDGTILSKFSDDSWDRTPYDPDGQPSVLAFKFWKEGAETPHRKELKDEIKWILYLLITERPGAPLSNGSLRNYLKLLTRAEN